MIIYMSDFETLRSQAIALRRAGKSRREIKEELALGSNWTLDKLLAGEPPPEWTKRPNAKSELRDKARELRGQGWVYRDIAKALGVSLSSCSLWLRDMPAPEPPEGEYAQERVAAMWRMRWERTLRRRGVERQQTKFAAAKSVGDLSERDVLVLGALAYWCEGSKDKPYDRREKVRFINSDRALVQFFLRFLEIAGVGPERIQTRLHIHETANAEDATRFWADVVGLDPASFENPVIKRHSPKTNRKNLAEEYRGCLEVSVRQSAELYRQIEGWAFGVMLGHVREEAERVRMPTSGRALAMVHELRARARQGGSSEEGSI